MFEKFMRNQAISKPPAPARKVYPAKSKKECSSGKSLPLNKAVKTTRLKGNQSQKLLTNTGQQSIQRFLERKSMEHSALLFVNSGIPKKIRDQNSKVMCIDASDLKTTEASNITDDTAHQLPDRATERDKKQPLKSGRLGRIWL